MTDRAATSKNAAKSARLVWVLVLLGLATGALTIWTVWSTLGEIRGQRAMLRQTEDGVGRLDERLGRGFTEVQSTMLEELSNKSAAGWSSDSIGLMTKSLDDFDGSMHNPEVAADIKAMHEFVVALKQLLDECAAWNHSSAVETASLADRKKTAETTITDFRAALSSAEGRRRLALAAKVRQYRKLSGKP